MARLIMAPADLRRAYSPFFPLRVGLPTFRQARGSLQENPLMGFRRTF